MKINKITWKILILIILTINVGCDQVSKIIVRENVEYNQRISIIDGFVTLTKVENTGAFLSLGHDLPRIIYKIIFIILPLIVLGYALYYLLTNSTLSRLSGLAICLIIGGGIGNIIDRILYGSVTDFLHFNFIIFQTGIVNMADISVTAGFFILVYELIIARRKPVLNTNK